MRPGLSVRPLKTGGSGSHSYDRHHPSVMPEALEAGTLNGHGIAGLSAALSFIEEAGVTELHEKALDFLALFLFRFFFKKNHDVDVRVREKLFAAVAAQGHKRDITSKT